jgi:hypothetical protein
MRKECSGDNVFRQNAKVNILFAFELLLLYLRADSTKDGIENSVDEEFE